MFCLCLDYEYDYHGYKDFRSGSYTDDYDYYYCDPEEYHYYGSYAAEPMPRGRGGRGGSHAPPYRGRFEMLHRIQSVSFHAGTLCVGSIFTAVMDWKETMFSFVHQQ